MKYRIKSIIKFVDVDTGEVVNKTRKEVLLNYDVIRKSKSFDYDSQMVTWYWLIRLSKQLKLKF